VKPESGHSPARGFWQVSVLLGGSALRATSVLARRGREIAIFDTGLSHHAGTLQASLAAAGIAPEDVTLVFNTHCHVDHSHNNALFPHARVFCSARDYEWTRTLHATLARIDRPEAEDVLPFYPEVPRDEHARKLIRKVLAIEKLLWDEARLGQREQFVWLEDQPPPAGIRMIPTPGHAPHHVSFVIQTTGRPVLVCGDALLIRGEEQSPLLLMPPCHRVPYERSRQLVTAFDGIVVPGHDAAYDNHPTVGSTRTFEPGVPLL
jgi:glyoxylase-like metal-dependent hydrolase (beta-lactamase superfamily II)